MSDLTKDELRVALMKADLYLKTRQGMWETPRNLAIIVGVAVALAGTAAGIVGFKLGNQPPAPINVHIDQPLVVKVAP
jgi:hypothetical protein